MTFPLHSTALLAFTALVLLCSPCRAAKAPNPKEKLKNQASLIVTGEVLAVTSKVEKSKIETAKGMHRDKIYSIKVRVKEISKGKEVKAGDEILVLAWQPHTRFPPVAGWQGHESIPKKGETATFYLKKDGKNYAPLMPNGIVVGKKKG